MHLNPYEMWEKWSPRQVFELLHSYKEMNKDIDRSGKDNSRQNYTVKSKKKVKIPSWLKVPEGATVYHADHIGDVVQGGI